jgi:outer membrane protein assembly factor BamB
MGDLRCLDAATGALVWSRNFRTDFGLKRAPVWGWSSSPLLEGDRLYCLVGGDGSAVVCFDAGTGHEIWRALSTEEIGYAPLLMHDVHGKKQLIVWHTEAVVGLEPATGDVFWSQDYPPEGERQRPEVSIAAPRMIGSDRLLLITFYHGAMLLKLPAGEGKPDLLWNHKSPKLMQPAVGLHTVMCTPVVKGNHIYGVCGHGELRCLELDTGKRVWETLAAVNHKRGLFAHAFLVEQADRFWIYNDQGDLILARLTPLGYEEIGRKHLLDTTLATRGRNVTWCHPAFANRCAYVRNDKELVCVSLAE